MFKKSISVLIMAALSAAGAAFAQPGGYVGIQGGIGGMDTKKYSANNNPYNSVSLRVGPAFRVFGGNLWTENNVDYGFEAGYEGYPKNNYKLNAYPGVRVVQQSYNGSNIDLLALVKINFNSDTPEMGAFVLGKAGFLRLTQEFDGQLNTPTGAAAYSSNAHAYKPEVVVGLGYNLSRNVSFDISYQHIFADQADPFTADASVASRISSVNTLMAGLTYHFS
jgi:opacity protein-like surface antigen